MTSWPKQNRYWKGRDRVPDRENLPFLKVLKLFNKKKDFPALIIQNFDE